jgi:hypothetical protein
MISQAENDLGINGGFSYIQVRPVLAGIGHARVHMRALSKL